MVQNGTVKEKTTKNTQTEEKAKTETSIRKSERPRDGTVQYGTVQQSIYRYRYKLTTKTYTEEKINSK